MHRADGSDRAFVDAVARRVVELLREQGDLPRQGPRLLTAAQVAKEFGVSTDWLYANAASLGAIRMGSGPRARLRFDRSAIEDRFARLAARRRGPEDREGRRNGRQASENGGLLPILDPPA